MEENVRSNSINFFSLTKSRHNGYSKPYAAPNAIGLREIFPFKRKRKNSLLVTDRKS